MEEHLEWQTIADVCAAYTLPYEMIRQHVKQASSNGETWVKMGVYPRRWLMHTGSSGFTRLLETLNGSFQQHYAPEGERLLPTVPSLSTEGELSRRSDVLDTREPSPVHSWPKLRQWLHDEGILVFANILAHEEDAPWQWQWGDLTGVGYLCIEDAVLGALQAKILQAERTLACRQSAKETRGSWFRWA